MENNQNGLVKKSPLKLKTKKFEERKSLISELLETSNFTTVKCLFYSILFGFIAHDVTCGLVFGKKADYGLRLILIGFAKFHIAVLLWIVIFCVNVVSFYLFKLWANVRISLMPKSLSRSLWDYIFLLGLIIYYCGGLILIPILIKLSNMGAASCCVILLEQLRITMKTHSFIRIHVPKVKNYKQHTDQQFSLPQLKRYLYFFFAPTMLYRTEYPQTKRVDKLYAIKCFLEVLAIIWLLAFIIDIFFVREFENVGTRKMEWPDVCAIILQNVLVSFLVMTSFFYLILDRWLSAWSEILRFGDRRFYEDWWTSTNYSDYLRKWNIVVQDWLFEYIYKEFYENIVPNNRRLAKFMVFLISAVFHEYVLIFMLDQFFPLLFFNFFVLGQILTNYYVNSKHPFFNMGFLYSLSLGNSIQLSLYTLELNARKHCLDNSSWSYFKPRIFNSDCMI